MKISVLVIAHNEEKHIAMCLRSILDQTKKPDEIILIAHNSTDKTLEIAKDYPVKVIPFSGPSGIIHARVEGLRLVSGDIILCIDGDSFAEKNWIEEMVKTLSRGNILVGSWIKLKGNLLGQISNFSNRLRCTHSKNPSRWLWGSSFAFWGKDKEYIKEFLEKSKILSRDLGLSRNPDDLWLALFMKELGLIEITNKTYVTQNAKEQTLMSGIKRNFENIRNGNEIEKYFKTRKLR